MANIETTTDIDYEIQKLLNSLEPDETDINKIVDVTHKCLLMMSVRDAVLIIINNKTDSDDDDDEEEEKMKLFDEIIQKSYLIKLKLLEKKLLN